MHLISRSSSALGLLAALVMAPPVAANFEPGMVDGHLDQRLEGVWASRGYGWVFDISADGPIYGYDVSETGCFRETYSPDDVVGLVRLFTREGDVVRVTGRAENSTIYTLDRLERVPSQCEAPPPDTPEGVLTHFADVMSTHYAFFDVHDVDWADRRAVAEVALKSDMSDQQLFSVLEAMLTGLRDGHLRLFAEVEGEREVVSPGRAQVGPMLDVAFEQQRRYPDKGKFQQKWYQRQRKQVKKLLGRSFHQSANDQLVWGRVGRIGYLAVFGMGGFAGDDDSITMATELRAVHDAMTKALADLADTDALIVDVTMNGGGYDAVSLAIAGHFTDTKTLAFTKVAHDAAGATPQSFHVLPAARGRYLGPVTLLTSNYTVSAAEIFTMAMRAMPTVTHHGEATRGALSDVLDKDLANGWRLTLSNEVYRDAEGVLWEGRGIAPAEAITVFGPDRIEVSRAEAIRKTLAQVERGLGESVVGVSATSTSKPR